MNNSKRQKATKSLGSEFLTNAEFAEQMSESSEEATADYFKSEAEKLKNSTPRYASEAIGIFPLGMQPFKMMYTAEMAEAIEQHGIGEVMAPLLKNGVNIANGDSLGNIFGFYPYFMELTAIHGFDNSDIDPNDMVAVGERREMLTRFFDNMAKYYFENMVKAFNHELCMEISTRFPELYRYATSTSSRMYYRGSEECEPSLVEVRSFFFGGGFDDYYDGNAKITNLMYYFAVPIGIIMQGLLGTVSSIYNNLVNTFNGALVEKPGFNGNIISDYPEFHSFLGIATIDLLNRSEAIVDMLYNYAMQLRHQGFPGEKGVTFATMTRANDASKNEFTKTLGKRISAGLLGECPCCDSEDK